MMVPKCKDILKVQINSPKNFIINDYGNLVQINQLNTKELNVLYQTLVQNLIKINNYDEFNEFEI